MPIPGLCQCGKAGKRIKGFAVKQKAFLTWTYLLPEEADEAEE
jgi:hypothetical protein